MNNKAKPAPKPFRPKTAGQNSKIWASASELYLSEEILRDIVESVTGQRSISALSSQQASRVIDRLEGFKRERKRKATRARSKNVVLMITPKQRAMIKTMASKIKWNHPDGFERFLKVRFGLDHIKTNDDVTKVKMALENMIKTGGRNKGATTCP